MARYPNRCSLQDLLNDIKELPQPEIIAAYWEHPDDSTLEAPLDLCGWRLRAYLLVLNLLVICHCGRDRYRQTFIRIDGINYQDADRTSACIVFSVEPGRYTRDYRGLLDIFPKNSHSLPLLYALAVFMVRPGGRVSGKDIWLRISEENFSASNITPQMVRLKEALDNLRIAYPDIQPYFFIPHTADEKRLVQAVCLKPDTSLPGSAKGKATYQLVPIHRDGYPIVDLHTNDFPPLAWRWGARPSLPITIDLRLLKNVSPYGVPHTKVSLLFDPRYHYMYPRGLAPSRDWLIKRSRQMHQYEERLSNESLLWVEYDVPDRDENGEKGDGLIIFGGCTTYDDYVATNMSLQQFLPKHNRPLWECWRQTIREAIRASANALTINCLIHLPRQRRILIRRELRDFGREQYLPSIQHLLTKPESYIRTDFALGEAEKDHLDLLCQGYAPGRTVCHLDLERIIRSMVEKEWGERVAKALSDIQVFGLAIGWRFGSRVLMTMASCDLDDTDVLFSIRTAQSVGTTMSHLLIDGETSALCASLHGDDISVSSLHPFAHATMNPFLEMSLAFYLYHEHGMEILTNPERYLPTLKAV